MSWLAITLWLLSIGFSAGFWYRVWGEKRAARHDPPAWIVHLGRDIAGQFEGVERGHKFAGPDVAITSTATYRRAGHTFEVSVERATVDT